MDAGSRLANVGAKLAVRNHAPSVLAEAPETPSVESGAPRPDLFEQIAAQGKWMVGNGIEKAEIQLDPPDLGKIRLRLAVIDGKVEGVLEVESPSVQAILESGLPKLSAALSHSGLELSRFDVLPQDGGRSSGRPTSEEREAGVDTGPDEPERAEAPALSRAARAGATGRVDYLF